SGRAARSAAPRECHTGSLPADISPAPPGLWADGRTSGCTRGTFLHTQKTDPVLPPASEGSVPAASDPLSLPCAASVASSPPPAFSFILPQQMIFSHFVNNPTLSRGARRLPWVPLSASFPFCFCSTHQPKQNGGQAMTTINLKDFYYWYLTDELLEVPDEVAEELMASKRREAAHAERVRYNKAYYSLDCDDGIEYSA